jgi:predicted TPR repeat methyltransferase
VLAPGGLFAFTVESHAGEGVVLGEGLRYAYNAGGLRELITDAGLVLHQLEPASSRTEGGLQVRGLVVVAAKG